MSQYLAIQFEGQYSSLLDFFNSKEWKFEIKNIGNNKIFVKLPEELVDEIKFFESPDATSSQMTKITTISEEEYNNTIENGFEIINHHGHNNLVKQNSVNIEKDIPLISNQLIKEDY